MIIIVIVTTLTFSPRPYYLVTTFAYLILSFNIFHFLFLIYITILQNFSKLVNPFVLLSHFKYGIYYLSTVAQLCTTILNNKKSALGAGRRRLTPYNKGPSERSRSWRRINFLDPKFFYDPLIYTSCRNRNRSNHRCNDQSILQYKLSWYKSISYNQDARNWKYPSLRIINRRILNPF